jgi:hypothetical protein
MGHACTHGQYPSPNGNEHPVVAVIAIIAIVAAILLIAWARLAVHGTHDIEAALSGPPAEGAAAPKPHPKSEQEREVDAAVTSSRFATGFSP